MKFYVMDHTGHSTIEFDENEGTINEAMAKFTALVGGGHIAATRKAGATDDTSYLDLRSQPMSDYFHNAGYDAGAVVDMNNLAIGYFPRTQASVCAAPMPQGPIPAPQVVPQPEVPAGDSGTSS